MKTETQIAEQYTEDLKKYEKPDGRWHLVNRTCHEHQFACQRFLEKVKEDVLRLEIIKDNDKTPQDSYGKREEDMNRKGKLPEQGKRFLTPFELVENLIREKKEEITDLQNAIKLYNEAGI